MHTNSLRTERNEITDRPKIFSEHYSINAASRNISEQTIPNRTLYEIESQNFRSQAEAIGWIRAYLKQWRYPRFSELTLLLDAYPM